MAIAMAIPMPISMPLSVRVHSCSHDTSVAKVRTS